MLPLLLVYIAEYTINQGVAPTLLFPLHSTPFGEFRSFYPTYNAIYQVGVFISRSSTPFFRVHHLYAPSFLQMVNLLLLTLHALFNFIPNVYIIFIIVFWEGLLGGLVYVRYVVPRFLQIFWCRCLLASLPPLNARESVIDFKTAPLPKLLIMCPMRTGSSA
jgi:hypothetical protein